jgi:hypothetical protein
MVINVRSPKDSPFPGDRGMVMDFGQLIDLYQTTPHYKGCALLDGKCRFGHSQETSGHIRIRGHNYFFARD